MRSPDAFARTRNPGPTSRFCTFQRSNGTGKTYGIFSCLLISNGNSQCTVKDIASSGCIDYIDFISRSMF